MELEEAKTILNKMKRTLDIKAPNVNIRNNDLLKFQAIEAVLQALDNCIPKEKVEKGIDRIEDYFDRLNGPDEDIDFIKEVKQELLEE